MLLVITQDGEPAHADTALGMPVAQLARSCSPTAAAAYSTSLVLPDSLEQSPMPYLDPGSLREHEQDQDPVVYADTHHMTSDCAASADVQMHQNTIHTACDDPSMPLGLQRGHDGHPKANDLGWCNASVQEDNGGMQKNQAGLSGMHQLHAALTRDEAMTVAIDTFPAPAAGAEPFVSCSNCRNAQGQGQAVTQTLPQMSELPLVRPNKRKREDSSDEQGATLSKQQCSAGRHWSTICCSLVQTIYRFVLIVWLVRDQMYDKP